MNCETLSDSPKVLPELLEIWNSYKIQRIQGIKFALIKAFFTIQKSRNSHRS